MRVALVHDYLTQHGGAERVLEELHQLWPEAPVFTSLYDPDALPRHWRAWDIRESVLRHLPRARHHHRLLMPLYPLAFRAFRRQLADYDVILSDPSAWAHQAPGGPGAVRIAYCHSPARFLWHDQTYLGQSAIPAPLRPLADAAFGSFRWLDRRAAAELDLIVANSHAVADRIREHWGRAATVIHPPVGEDRFLTGPSPPAEDWWLVVSRLVPHKRVDLAVQAFTRLQRPLRVVGTGPELDRLRAMAGPTVTFPGSLDDAATADLMRRCRGFLLPGREDFGITAVEAQAAGRPVIAFGEGGARESVIDGRTGILFPEQTVASLIDAIARADAIDWQPDACVANARRFAAPAFRQAMRAIVERTWIERTAGR